MHNLRVWRDPRYPKTDILMKADYFFNNGSTGDVTFRMINGKLWNIDYWDAASRKPNVGPNKLYTGIAVAVLIGLAAASAN